jgi:outer membrane protein OmpA-like peptidoglycan-associated protein
MMKRIQTRLTAVLMAMLLTTAFSAHAQEAPENYVDYPYAFIGIQGGGQTTLSGCSAWKLVTPTASVQVGVNFTPIIGARIHVNGIWNKGALNLGFYDAKYKYKYATSDLDLLINMVNLICKGNYHPLNVYLIGGVGLNYAWGNQDMSLLTRYISSADTRNRLSHNFRIGTMIEANVARNWSVNLELAANSLSDRYNCQFNGRDDWQFTAQIGLTYKFGMPHKVKNARRSGTGGVNDDIDLGAETISADMSGEIAKPEPKPAPAPVPAPVVQKESLTRNIFFSIRETAVAPAEQPKVAEIAAWLKSHPKAKVVVTGYADKGTGSAVNNARFAKGRAESVTKMLTKKYGVDASRITTTSKGDTVQPFPDDNDKNRVTIVIAEE